ncbi:YkgJ family cysteine cluster protein [Candidatus Omnitrophota bacterium]
MNPTVRKMLKLDCQICPKKSACCQEGVWVDLAEAKKIASLGLGRQFYQLEQDPEFPSGYKLSTSLNDQPCSFLCPSGLCRIHKIDYSLKPSYCKEFPYEDGKLSAEAEYLCALYEENKP